jgi:hypothetical protein
MKNRIAIRATGIIAALLGVLAVGPVQDAGATPLYTRHNGVACTYFNGGEAKDIDFFSRGVVVKSSSARSVICPVAHASNFAPNTFPSPSPVLSYWGENNSSTAVSCTVNVYKADGGFRKSVSSAPTGRFFFDALVLSSIASSDTVTLLCTLPGSSQTTLEGFEFQGT